MSNCLKRYGFYAIRRDSIDKSCTQTNSRKSRLIINCSNIGSLRLYVCALHLLLSFVCMRIRVQCTRTNAYMWYARRLSRFLCNGNFHWTRMWLHTNTHAHQMLRRLMRALNSTCQPASIRVSSIGVWKCDRLQLKYDFTQCSYHNCVAASNIFVTFSQNLQQPYI